MSGINDRKDKYEKKYAHDQEFMFRAEARCCKLFGLWAAEQLGITGSDADTYAGGVVTANLEEPGFDDVKRHVMPDFQAKDLDISDHMFEVKMDEYMKMAIEQVKSES